MVICKCSEREEVMEIDLLYLRKYLVVREKFHFWVGEWGRGGRFQSYMILVFSPSHRNGVVFQCKQVY